MKKDLLTIIKGENETLDMGDLKESLVGLFDDVLQDPTTPEEKRGTIARFRSRILIELKDL